MPLTDLVNVKSQLSIADDKQVRAFSFITNKSIAVVYAVMKMILNTPKTLVSRTKTFDYSFIKTRELNSKCFLNTY